MTFENKTILITGTSTGIGKAISQKLLQKSCNLVLIARRDDLIQEIVDNSENPLAKVKIIKCDVSNKDDVQIAYHEAIAEFGRIDAAILNSGVGNHVTAETFNSKYAKNTMNINFLGVVYWVEQLLPEMMKRRDGIIAPVSSLADNRGRSGSGFYCESKAALSIFSIVFS
ncbi:MAG: SDR family oxidoreductase [Bacteroidota bacterium]